MSKIEKLRKGLQVAQSVVAHLAGIDQSSYSLFTDGKRKLSRETMTKIEVLPEILPELNTQSEAIATRLSKAELTKRVEETDRAMTAAGLAMMEYRRTYFFTALPSLELTLKIGTPMNRGAEIRERHGELIRAYELAQARFNQALIHLSFAPEEKG
jgi:hypothetical protein